MAKKIHPLDLNSNVAIGVDLPLAADDNTFFKLNYTTLEQAKANLKNLILTEKGERYMLPEFGCNLRHSVFNQNNIVVDEVRDSIEQAITDWLPYIKVESLDISIDEDNEHIVYIELNFSLKIDSETTDSLTVQVIA